MSSALLTTVVLLASVLYATTHVATRAGRLMRARRDRADRLGTRLWGVLSVMAARFPRRLRGLTLALAALLGATYLATELADLLAVYGVAMRLPRALVVVHDGVPLAAFAAATFIVARRRNWESRRHHAKLHELGLMSALLAFLGTNALVHVAPQALAVHVSALFVLGAVAVTGRTLDLSGRVLKVFFRDLHDAHHSDVPSEFGVRPELREKTAELREQFLRDGRVKICDLLPPEIARQVGLHIARRNFELGGKSPVGPQDDAGPNYLAYASRLSPEPQCTDACAPLCAFAASLMDGPLRDWLREVTGLPRLINRTGENLEPVAMAQAFAKGCYFGAHTDLLTLQHDEVKIVVVWHASENWDPSWGGLLRFFNKADGFRDEERNPDTRIGYEEGEVWVPRFNELHVLRAERDGVHEVTMVTTDEAVRYTLAARLLQPTEALAGV